MQGWGFQRGGGFLKQVLCIASEKEPSTKLLCRTPGVRTKNTVRRGSKHVWGTNLEPHISHPLHTLHIPLCKVL